MWVEKLHDMEESKMDMPTDGILYHHYLAKISADLRVKVLGGEWLLEGESSPARRAKTWQDIANAAEISLEE